MKLDKKTKIIVAACALLVVAIVGTVVLNYSQGKSRSASTAGGTIAEFTTAPTSEPTATPAPKISVHIKGEVLSPGLYELEEGARLNDAVTAAGGLTENAAEDSINLAMRLHDEDEINIPSKSQAGSSQIVDNPSTSASENSGKPSATNKLNINTASVSELDTLLGIGPAYAQAIVDYRDTNGPFGTIEDLMKVSGIGQKRFNDIKDMICVD